MHCGCRLFQIQVGHPSLTPIVFVASILSKDIISGPPIRLITHWDFLHPYSNKRKVKLMNGLDLEKVAPTMHWKKGAAPFMPFYVLSLCKLSCNLIFFYNIVIFLRGKNKKIDLDFALLSRKGSYEQQLFEKSNGVFEISIDCQISPFCYVVSMLLYKCHRC